MQFNDLENGTTLESLRLSDDANEILASNRGLGKENPFSPLDIGKPMTIKLVTVYAGNYKNGLFRNKKDMIVTSRIKAPHIPEEAQRAVHQIYIGMPEKVAVMPGPGNYGTPLIYCAPAFVDDGMMINLEFKIDNFNEGQMKAAGNILSVLGTIPIFSTASGILLFAGAAVKQAAPLINTLAEKKPWLSFNFDTPIREAGRKALEAGFYRIINQADEAEFKDYEIALSGNNQPELRKKGARDTFYRGDRPYAIISINGEMADEHAGFSPALASAAILQKFYGIRENGAIDEDIKGLLNLSNDYYFHQKIERLTNRLKTAEEGSEEYKQMQEKINAYKKNLQTDIFKAG